LLKLDYRIISFHRLLIMLLCLLQGQERNAIGEALFSSLEQLWPLVDSPVHVSSKSPQCLIHEPRQKHKHPIQIQQQIHHLPCSKGLFCPLHFPIFQ
jgi:hypothetical protein